MHNYKSQSGIADPMLASKIDAVENSFNFAAFARVNDAFNESYTPGSGFVPYTYSGYTNENKVISLAAAISTAHNVPLASTWNADTGRQLVSVTTPSQNYLEYSYGTDYRPPFNQALINLFADTSERGADSFSNRALAHNPWENFVRYEADVATRLQQLGRTNLFQPDAGAGPVLVGSPPAYPYHTYNIFNNFGEPNTFQPWSVTEAMLAGARRGRRRCGICWSMGWASRWESRIRLSG